MNIADNTSVDVNTIGGGIIPPSTGFAPDVLPEVQPIKVENSQTGVSTRNVPLPKEIQEARRALRTPHWYAVRCAYGQEKKAYEYIINNKGTAYYPTIKVTRLVNDRRKAIEESYIPNILFLYGTFDVVKTFVYDNVHDATSPLRFYYRHTYTEGSKMKREPLIVPDHQIESLRIICNSNAEDILFVSQEIQKFKEGQNVRIIGGQFQGVVGKVARYQGQQRVAVIIDGLMTVVTAYIPSAFLERII